MKEALMLPVPAFLQAHPLDLVLLFIIGYQAHRIHLYKTRMMDWFHVASDHEDEIKRLKTRRKARP